MTDTDDELPPPYQDPKENVKSPVKSKAASTPRKVQDLPEGYVMERTPSTSNPKRKYIKITGPGGKTFTSIRAANEYYEQNKNNDNNTEIYSERESSDNDSKKDSKLSQTKKTTDKNDAVEKKVSAETKPLAKTATPAAKKATVTKSKRFFLMYSKLGISLTSYIIKKSDFKRNKKKKKKFVLMKSSNFPGKLCSTS